MGGKTSAKSKNEWIAKAYDRINLTVPKGQKNAIQAAAQAQGESVNSYIYGAIVHRMEHEKIQAVSGGVSISSGQTTESASIGCSIPHTAEEVEPER